MNENNENEVTEPLVTEPEQEIDTLAELEKKVVPMERTLEGLPYLVRKIYPYTFGLIVSIVNYVPTIIAEISKSAGSKINNFFITWQQEADKEKGHYLQDVLGMSERVVEYQKTAKEINPILGGISYVFFLCMGFLFNILGELPLIRARIVRQLNRESPTQVPSPESIVTASIKKPENWNIYETLLSELGLGTDEKKRIYEAIKQIPDLSILMQNLWRGKITPIQFNEYLAKLAFDEDEQEVITNIVDRIPPIQDIIRFAVREAFHEGLSAKYKHDYEFPKEVADWAAKQGFPEHWAKKYWRAHWELPSVQMAFEMLHRKVKKDDGSTFKVNDIHDLLKMADYAPTWRNLLTQISYRVITRVDARRMYDMGVWDNLPDMTPEEKVKQVYESQGYNSEDAQYMTDFTVQYTEQKRRAFTTAGLKKLRKYGIISEDTLREKLSDIRVRPDEIDYVVDETNYELEDKKLDSFMNYAKSMYLNDRWDESDVQTEMIKVGLHVSDTDNLFEAWRYDKIAKRRILTKTDIQRLLEKGLIKTRQEAINKFLELGYDQQSSAWLTDEMVDFTLGSK